MFKYLALTLVVLLSACAGPNTEPVDLTGYWETNGDSEISMSATVTNGVLSIMWVDDSMRGLYWEGTVPATVMAGDIFVSEADVEALRVSIVGSLDETKEFTYADNRLSYDLSIMGVTQTLYLEKVEQ